MLPPPRRPSATAWSSQVRTVQTHGFSTCAIHRFPTDLFATFFQNGDLRFIGTNRIWCAQTCYKFTLSCSYFQFSKPRMPVFLPMTLQMLRAGIRYGSSCPTGASCEALPAKAMASHPPVAAARRTACSRLPEAALPADFPTSPRARALYVYVSDDEDEDTERRCGRPASAIPP